MRLEYKKQFASPILFVHATGSEMTWNVFYFV